MTDDNREFKFTNLPTPNSLVVDIDNHNQMITNNANLNIYPNFNNKFMRLLRGDNTLKISGKAQVKFICEFPVNVGG